MLMISQPDGADFRPGLAQRELIKERASQRCIYTAVAVTVSILAKSGRWET